MPKKLKKCAKDGLNKVQIRNISKSGLYIVVKEQEYFLPFAEFRWSCIHLSISELFEFLPMRWILNLANPSTGSG
jgi:hypothetical protein